MSKWKVNLKQAIENFHRAKAAYETENLIGLIFGRKEDQVATNIFFVPSESSDVSGLKQEIESTLAPDVDFLGFASTNDSIKVETLFENLGLNNGQSLKTQFSLDSLNAKNVKKLQEESSILENVESLTIPDGVFVKTTLTIHLKSEAENEVLEEINKKKSELQELSLTHEETKSKFSKDSSATSLPKIQKVDKKNYIVLKPSGSIVENNESGTKTIDLNILVKVSTKSADAEIFTLLTKQIGRLLDQVLILYKREKKLELVISNTFALASWSSLVSVVTYSNVEEEVKKDHRKYLHKLLNLPLDGPRIRPSQAIKFEESDSKLLVNPHETIKYTPIGQVSIVKGNYHYHHYMQDNFDDSGWGCAYRSFQTIWSWFVLQGYTDKPVPTHKEIQQCLVDIGDKPAKFAGSRQWIGSMELSFCLETMLGFQSRILTTNSGKEVGEHCRALLYHFDNNGSPVMIGGGQLAHTILGVDYNTKSGECKFLVLDPHYTGDENLNFILKKGWCAWKPLSFWNPKSFYNLMLPINPKGDV